MRAIPRSVLPAVVASLVLLADVHAGSAPGPTQAAQQASPEFPARARVDALIAAFDAGDLAAFRAFTRDHYAERPRHDDDVECAAAYWAAVRREIGPIKLIRAEKLPVPGREDIVWWVRGTVTQAVVGLRVDVEPVAPHRITRTGVMRGPDPVGGRDPIALPRDPRAYLDEYLARAAERDLFSGIVVVAQGEEILFERAYGWADREAGEPASNGTPFRLASVTKMFTAVAVAQLAEQGLLAYDDTIDRFIPEYPEHIASKVTIHHLLTHTSGIEIDEDADYQEAVRQADSLDALLAAQVRFLPRLNLGNYENFEPLGRFDYTNEGIDLLGVIVARASGMRWRDYVRENVFNRAGMENAGTDLLDPVAGLAAGYTLRNEALSGFLPGTRRRVTDDELGARLVIRPAGSGYATGRDMIRFLAALQDGRLLSAASLATVTTRHALQMSLPGMGERGYGYGFMLTTAQGLATVGHDGGATGMSTVVEFHPELGTSLVVLSNYDRIASHYAGHIRELLAAR